MADLEIRKHAKQALKSITKKDNKGLWHNIKEFLLEIFIIVFAVSLSIWLHGLSEKSHHAEEVRDFLTDVKSDLAADRENILIIKKSLIEGHEENSKTHTKKKQSVDKITIDAIKKPVKESTVVQNFITRKTNSGNYEGFKSSGNIAYIHNKPLKSKILKYYEQDVKTNEDLEKIYNNQMEKVMDLALSKNNHLTANNYFLNLYRENVIKNYDVVILKIDKILNEIDKELK